MSDWKLHTPNGVNDILPSECSVKKEIESTIWSVFASIGYKEVETPSFEYYDCYLGEGGMISQETMFKFFDEQGRILALRPDFTTSIARMAATKTADKTPPLRYMYSGSVFRAEQTQGARQREFTQSGIELIGSYSPSADAEVISAAIEAIMAVGIEDFSMEIGQVAFFNGLVEQAGLDDELTEKLRERIDSKDSVGIKTIVDKLNIDNDIKNLMIELPYLFGDMSVLKKAYVVGLNETSKLALDNIKRIYELLCLYGFEKYISIDLGMLQSIDYYTGSIFKCYTHGVGFPICAGGRYDNLMGKFGSPKGAVGVAIGVNRIMAALGREASEGVSSSLVFAEKNAEGIGYDLAYNLRVNGCLVEMYIGDGDYLEAEKYALSTDTSCMLRIFPNGKLQIKDFTKQEIIETTANEFLGYYDSDLEYDEECGCGHEHNHGECGCGHEHHHSC
ncbi:MAG: ATP phosphoribosyltransferase regulatory subunit [Oscillospiraceae bacterium]|nr:ATP phosphoribosyltransferase regulatory subunit [Oscillospiraceae bacterium]